MKNSNVLQLEIPGFQELYHKLETMEKKLEQIAKQDPLKDTWLDSQEVATLLRVTSRTLQNYRDQGILPFSQVGSKIYYRASDIQAHLDRHYVNKTERRGV